MSRPVATRARATATRFLRNLWRRRATIWTPTPSSPDEIFPLDLRAVVEDGLGVQFDDPEHIPSTTPVPAQSVPVQTAGFIDRHCCPTDFQMKAA